MALTKSLDDLALGIRRAADVESRTDRFPTAEIYDYANLGLGALMRKLKQAIPDQLFLASHTFLTDSGVSTYPLPSNFRSLISIHATIDGSVRWFDSYEMHERPDIISPNTSYSGQSYVYRLQPGNIDLLPIPTNEYSIKLWYVPNGPQLAAGAESFDTIERLDQYVIWWGAREVARKEKWWDLYRALTTDLKELESDIYVLARSKDLNSPPHMVDVYKADRFGRRSRVRR